MENFTFAGFTFPRMVATLPRGFIGDRLATFKKRAPRVCGPYMTAPRPLERGEQVRGFYDGDTGRGEVFDLRQRFADDVDGAHINHRGWFTDPDCSDTVRGLAFILPRSRGFLAGWTMGGGMCASIDTGEIFGDIESAAMAGDDLARIAAEHEREYQERERELCDARDAVESVESELDALRATFRMRLRVYLDAAKHGARVAAAAALEQCHTTRERFAALRDDLRDARETLSNLEA